MDKLWAYLMRMSNDERNFLFVGKQVCSSFLVEEFGFSCDLQLYVKNDRWDWKTTIWEWRGGQRGWRVAKDIQLARQILLQKISQRQLLHQKHKIGAIKHHRKKLRNTLNHKRSLWQMLPLCKRDWCRHMESCKSDTIVTFLNRQVRRVANKIPDKSEAHLPFNKKKDVYAVFWRAFAILYRR